MFKLDSKLEKDSDLITDLQLSQLRLINNKDYVWLLLVPKISNARELIDLLPLDYNTLNEEIRNISILLKDLIKPYKLNIATIGNVVEQLHIHIIARFSDDKLYPQPVWGHKFTPYAPEKKNKLIEKVQKHLATKI